VRSEDLRSTVKVAATAIPGAKLWPNGLGFDHHGTQYTYSERIGQWTASRRVSLSGDWAWKYGEGSTPQAAREAAGIGRPEHRIRGGVA